MMASGIGNGSSNPLDNLRYPLEQQLLDIMRNASSENHYRGMLFDSFTTSFSSLISVSLLINHLNNIINLTPQPT